jgi:ribosomal protein S18 acetylase RimI-like enzyme
VATELEVHPVTPDRWDDLVELFGERGASSGCWCMFFRLTGEQFQRQAGAAAREGLRALVREGAVPGLLAYAEGRPVGWCSVAPRDQFQRVLRSPVLRPVDDRRVWSVVCFYIDRASRRRGVAERLVDAAVRHAAAAGAEALEGYPRDTSSRPHSNAELYVGTVSMFQAAGFQEVERRSPTRPIMRLELGSGAEPPPAA